MNRWRAALEAFPKAWRPLVCFQLAFALVAGALLSPSLAWLLDRVIRSTGDFAISNFDLLSFFLSFKGVAFLAGSASVAVALLYLELTGLLLITADPDRPVRALPVLQYALKRFEKLLRLGLLQVLGMALVAVPFAGGIGVVKLILLSEHDINYYLYHHPPEWIQALVIAGVLALAGGTALLFLALRWLFALPILLSSHIRPIHALRESWLLTRGHLLESLGALGGWWLATSVSSAVLVGLITWLGGGLLQWAGLRPALVFFLVAALLTLLVAITLPISFLTKGINAILINNLFSEFTERSVVAPPDLPTARGGRAIRNPIRLIWLVIFTGFLGMMIAGVIWVQSLDIPETVAITAHRGSSRLAPENTLSSLRQAIEDGADYAEIDVQRTRDGQVVLLHDRDFMRLGGDPRRIEDLTLEEAREIDIGTRFDPAFAGERIATLAEAIDLVRGELRLNIELKYNRPDPALAAGVVEVVRQKGVVEESVITSLDLASLQEVKRIEPRLKTGLVLTRSVGNPARLPVDFLSVNTAAAGARLISYARRNGKAIHVWTVNDSETMARMVEAGVDNVITDEPAEMQRFLEERAELTPAEKLALQLRRRLLN